MRLGCGYAAMLAGNWHSRMEGFLLGFQIQGHRGMLDSIKGGHHVGVQQNSNPAHGRHASLERSG